MQWWRHIKHAVILKVASPMAPVVCPQCAQKMLVDVNQKLEGNAAGLHNSEDYDSGAGGECYTQCPNSARHETDESFIYIKWSGEYMNFTRPMQVRSASQEEVVDATRFQNKMLVWNTPITDDEMQMYNEILQGSQPIQGYERTHFQRPQ